MWFLKGIGNFRQHVLVIVFLEYISLPSLCMDIFYINMECRRKNHRGCAYPCSRTAEAEPGESTCACIELKWPSTSSPQKSSTALVETPIFVYGHLTSTVPTSRHDWSKTFASGEAPSQPLVGWVMNPHFCVVNPPWLLWFINPSYFPHAVVSFCQPKATGGESGSKNGLQYRTCVRRGTDCFFCIRIWPQTEEVIQIKERLTIQNVCEERDWLLLLYQDLTTNRRSDSVS